MGALILFVLKKGGTLRIVVNYRALNIYTIKNCTALPLIGKILNCLSTTKIYTKLNLKDTYYRIYIYIGNK